MSSSYEVYFITDLSIYIISDTVREELLIQIGLIDATILQCSLEKLSRLRSRRRCLHYCLFATRGICSVNGKRSKLSLEISLRDDVGLVEIIYSVLKTVASSNLPVKMKRLPAQERCIIA